jgi:urate oxidase
MTTSNAISFKLDRNINGNKIVKITRSGFTGFSLQTLGNLPHTHRRPMKERFTDYDYFVVLTEVSNYVAKHGTVKQKALIAGNVLQSCGSV